jgi:hypothetical protein
VSEPGTNPETTAEVSAGADRPDPRESARQNLRPMIIESIGGWRGMIDSGLPVVVFVAANAIGGLSAGIWAALAAGVVLCILRLLRRQSLQQAIGGLFGVAIAAFIAWRMGEARGYFLLGIWRNAVYGGIFLISVLVRRPLIGVIWEFLDSTEGAGGGDWRKNARLLRAYYVTTLLWVGVFGARVIVQRAFYNRDETGWLGVTSLVMGYPLYAAALGTTFLVVRRAKRSLAAAA